MKILDNDAAKLKLLFGAAVFFFLVGLVSQQGAESSANSSVYWLYFHELSIFFPVSLVFGVAAYHSMQSSAARGHKLVKIYSTVDGMVFALYVLAKIVAFFAAAAWISIFVLERIDSSYGYGALALFIRPSP